MSILKKLPQFRWVFLCLSIILLTAYINIPKNNYIFSGFDAMQIYSKEWVSGNGFYTWTHWVGEGSYSSGFLYRIFHYILLVISDFFGTTVYSQSFWYYLFYIGGSYVSFLFSLTIYHGRINITNNIYSNIYALVYAFNPYTFYLFYFIWGFNPYPILYIFFPLIFAYFWKFLESEKFEIPSNLAIILLFSNFGFSNVSFFIGLNLILILILLLYFIVNKKGILFLLKKVLILLFVEFLSNGWYLIPQAQYWVKQSINIQSSKIFNFSEWILWQRLSFRDLASLDPFSLSGAIDHPPTYLFGLLFISSLIALLLVKNYSPRVRKSTLIILITITIIFIIETKGRGILPESAAIALFTTAPLSAFRSYGKVYIFLPFLLIYGIYLAMNSLRNLHKKRLSFLLIFASIATSFPLFTGLMQDKYSSIFKDSENCETSEYCFLKKIPRDYEIAAEIINNDLTPGKILYAPFSVINSPGWANYPLWKHVGNDPTIQLFNRPVIQMTSYDSFGFPYGKLWSQNGIEASGDILRILSNLRASFIVFHKDIDPKFIEPSLTYLEKLSTNKSLVKVYDSLLLNIYKVPNNAVQGIFSYAKTNSRDQNYLEFTQINPTKFRIMVPLLQTDINIIFRESFSDGWQLYISGPQKSLQQLMSHWWATFFLRNLTETDHRRLDSFANMWTINPSRECQKFNCEIVQMPSGKYIALFVEFLPQKIVFLYISTWILLLFILLGIHRNRKIFG